MPTSSPRSRRRSRVPSAPSSAHQRRASAVAGRAREPRRRPRITFGKRSTGRAGKGRTLGSCVLPRASPACCATATASARRAICWRRFISGSPKDLAPPICSRRSDCWPSWSRPSSVTVAARACYLDTGRLNGRLRRNLAVALRSGEGPLTIRFPDFRHCAARASGLVS